MNPEQSATIAGTRQPVVTICVLCYGDFVELARRTIDSILAHGDRSLYHLFVGANMVGEATASYLHAIEKAGRIDHLVESPTNVNKCPMMRRLFDDVRTPLIWWFDDDSYVAEPDAMSRWLSAVEGSSIDTVMWGHQFFFGHERDFSYGTDVVGFVKAAPWYRGKAPPSWEPGGNGVADFQGQGTGDGRWFFLTGGCWMARTENLRALDWPDRRLIKRNDDVFLCEAVRQQGWQVADIGPCGVAINTAARRGAGEDAASMQQQMSAPVDVGPALDLEGWFYEDEAKEYQRLAERVVRGTIVEVGVFKGRSLATILETCRRNDTRIVAVDTWLEPGVRQAFERNLAILGYSDIVERVQCDSVEASTCFANESVDLVFIDADHSRAAVRADLRAWLPKVKPGGVLFGHDYTWKAGVRAAVHEVLRDAVMFPAGSLWCHEKSEHRQRAAARGAVFIPTFEDSDLLAANFGDRPGIFGDLDVFVVDDANESREATRLRALCDRNGWNYWHSGRAPHVPQGEAWRDVSAYNRFIWETFLRLGTGHDFVIKMDTDALIIDAEWSSEMTRLLSTGSVIAGTEELRPTRDVGAFWDIARARGWEVDLTDYVAHMQGGIYGLSRSAIEALRQMGFLEGTHCFFSEDCYISYCCQLLGVQRVATRTVGSWHQPYRPPLQEIDYLLAVHPLTRKEWDDHRATMESRDEKRVSREHVAAW